MRLAFYFPSAMKVKNILILGVQVPFTRGGAEVLIDRLEAELRARDFNVDVVNLPFSAQPKANILAEIARWRSLELNTFAGKKVDLVIPTKFPSYMVPHKNKVPWLVHQHRQVYELYGTRFGDFETTPEDESIREMVMEADRVALNECKKIFTISPNVSSRVKDFLGFDSTPLLPPLPHAGQYQSSSTPEPYMLYVGRICSIKRVDLIVRALPRIDENVKLKLVGIPDEPEIEEFLQSEIAKHHLAHRVEFLGRVSDEELLNLYTKALGVFYAPYDEDYGLVTLEALASGVPVITASDSGCVLQFIEHEKNGLVAEPNETAIAEAVNRLYLEGELRERLQQEALKLSATDTWDEIISKITSG